MTQQTPAIECLTDDRPTSLPWKPLYIIKRLILAVRLAQIRKTTSIVLVLTKITWIGVLIRWARSWLPLRTFLHFLVGYRRTFETMAEAKRYASDFIPAGHESKENANLHLRLSMSARPSDYPVILYLGRLLTDSTRVFDLGGNVGNLFYCYQQYLTFGSALLDCV